MKHIAKPIHPSKAGLHEPVKTFIRDARIEITFLSTDGKTFLSSIVKDWEQTKKGHVDCGDLILIEPYIDSGHFYGSSAIAFKYRYSYVNVNYEEDKLKWETALALYEKELTDYLDANIKRHKAEEEALDEKILKAERRLANLKAVKAGKEIPYP